MIDRVGHIVMATDPMYLISVGHADVLHPLCLVWFGKDGTIYAEPRFPDAPGLMSVVAKNGEEMIDLHQGGSRASIHPKLSHHPTGRVHFSRTNRVDSSVGMTSFPLASGTGKVFDLKVWNAGRLPTAAKRRPQRGRVDFRFANLLPVGVLLSGNWVRVADMMAEIPASTQMVEPMVRLPQHNNWPMFLARPPRGYPHRSHVLVLSLTEGVPGPADDATMFFAGGFNPDATSPFLAALFPWHATPEDEARLRSADLPAKPGGQASGPAADTRNKSEPLKDEVA